MVLPYKLVFQIKKDTLYDYYHPPELHQGT